MKVENYNIEKELSRGPITTVFLATQIALDRPVLLKILNVQWKGEKDLVERFRREAKICARLKHPNVVNIFDFGTTANSFFLVMEYVEGCNLDEFIRKYHPLPFRIIALIFHELLKGIEYAHGQGVIHRDIKPANILMGNDGSVKISDFGLATIADFPALTEMGGTVGTPAYMSPEQAEGKKLSPPSDLFSLGATIYEMTCQESPFMGENFAESIRHVLHKSPAPLLKKRADIPHWFSELVGKLLEKNPQKRASSAGEIIQELKHNIQLPDQSILVGFIKEPSDYSVDPSSAVRDSRKSPKKLLPLYILLLVLALVTISVFFLKRPTGPVSPNTIEGEPAKNGFVVDSMELVNKSNSDTSNQQRTTPPGKTPETKLAVRQIPNEEKRPEKINEPVISPESEPVIEESKPGKIYISTYPWAKIFIDGEYKETTPLKEPINLEAGTYRLKLDNPNFKAVEQEIEIQSGLTDTLNFNLSPSYGFLTLQVVPWAEVYINGKYIETTPFKDPLQVTAGKLELKLVNPNFATWADSIEIEAGQTIQKRISLLKKG